jgi:hypothetical protein
MNDRMNEQILKSISLHPAFLAGRNKINVPAALYS